MKLAVVLSGTIRLYPKSLNSIQLLRDCGHTVDVYMHAWSNVTGAHAGHWRDNQADEPTPELINEYQGVVSYTQHDWQEKALEFQQGIIDRLTKAGVIITSLNPIGMYYSLMCAYAPLMTRLLDYDGAVRLRYDGRFSNDPFAIPEKIGWVIPDGADFGGYNDRLAWMWISGSLSMSYAEAYFNIYSKMEDMLLGGCEYNPEIMLKTSLDYVECPITRTPFQYSILGF